MNESKKEKIVGDLLASELLHSELYGKFAGHEKSEDRKNALKKLAQLEKKHAMMWKGIASENYAGSASYSKIRLKSILAFKKVAGLAITMKVIEHGESNLRNKIERAKGEFSEKEKKTIIKIQKSEEKDEEPLEKGLIEANRFFSNIRDIMFGMNDGLVELLAVVVGLAAALESPILIFIAGLIVAISGTLSMAAGAYLSTDYQKKIDGKMRNETSKISAARSGFYVGIFYFIGTLFPLSPFIMGISGYTGIILAIIVTGVVLTITSALISLASDKSIVKGVAKTLAISLGVAIITIILGSYIRSAFHITV